MIRFNKETIEDVEVELWAHSLHTHYYPEGPTWDELDSKGRESYRETIRLIAGLRPVLEEPEYEYALDGLQNPKEKVIMPWPLEELKGYVARTHQRRKIYRRVRAVTEWEEVQ